MKTKIYTLVLLLWLSICHAQNLQNAIWHFGNHAGLNFNNLPPTPLTTLPTTLGFTPIEGCASVSDQAGNLLFFTDGIKVWRAWNGGYQVIATGLNGATSSAQNAIIIPRPNHIHSYYIVTIDGFSGGNKGLYYSEIDLSNGLGQVVFQNVPLKDDLGNPITVGRSNFSESISSTIHANKNDYWLVAHVSGTNTATDYKLLSYKVTQNGIVNESPTFALPLLIRPYALKISPDSQKIAIGGNAYAFLGTFNNNSGAITMNMTNLSGGASVYGIEFSPLSNVLYFTPFAQMNKIFVTDVATPSNQYIINAGNYYYTGMQLGIDGKIYISHAQSGAFASVLSDPNTYANPQFGDHTIATTRSFYSNFPQWVHWQPNCDYTVTLTAPTDNVVSGNSHYRQASNNIVASNTISSGATVAYHADQEVLLKDGFTVLSNSKFRAYLQGCTNNYLARNPTPIDENYNVKNDAPESDLAAPSGIKIAPNPTDGHFQIVLNNIAEGKIEIIDMFGNSILEKTVKGEKEIGIDLQNHKKGLYLVRVISDTEVLTQKILKK